MKKLFTLLLTVAASVGTMFASTKIGDLYYNLNATNQTAEVTYKSYTNLYNEGWGITTANIPASVEYNSVTYSVISIGDSAFYGCSSLASVTIPNSVTYIGYRAFENCSSLTSVTIPNSVTYIGYGAFMDCSGLTSPVYNAHVFAYMPTSYSGAYTIPDGIESIAGGAFWRCSGLKSVTIPNSVTSIGYLAFYGCTGLTSVTIPNSVTSIGNYAFRDCTGLTFPVYNAHVFAYMPNSYLSAYTFGAYTIPDGIESIAGGAFDGCTGLKSVTIPNSVTSIGYAAFFECTGLKSVTIPNSVTSIGDEAFWRCIGLTSITIPNSVTSIGYWAFYECTGLTSIEIPSGVESIVDNAFARCIGLTSINVASDNPNYCSVNGVLFNKNRTMLISYPGGKQGAYSIPNSVTSIGNEAFFGCSGLTSVTIPNSVTSMGWEAFYNCGLTSITCEVATPPTLGTDAFSYVDTSIPLYVPAGSVSAYKSADQWKDFSNILPISARETETTSVQAEPTDNSVSVSWPQVSGAASYELVIKDKDGNVLCTLIFNAQGQLTSIAFNAPSRDGAPQHTQTAGFSYTITGLEAGTDYNLTITAKNSNGQVLDKREVSFHTNWHNAIENLQVEGDQPVKVYHEGHIYILRGEHIFDTQGKMVK